MVLMQSADVLRAMLMYFVLPLWLAAGFADYLCHRATHIERTSGWRESVLHLVQLIEMGIPVLAALFLEINAAVILIMIVCLLLHEVTAIWDTRYASTRREITPTEQHVHSFLDMLPLMGLLLVIALNWDQFVALFGLAPSRWELALKPEPLPWLYVTIALGATFLFELLPYIEELVRGLRHRSHSKPAGPS
jgi:hypothetical protein